jgi:LacI family transcriptional regulator
MRFMKSPVRARPVREKATMKTIAEEAGVTLTTVSRILSDKSGKYKYAEKTREKIFAIAERLKYRPNALVLGMQSGKTGTAGVLIPTSSWFYSQIVAGIHEIFLDHQTIMLLDWNSRSLNKKDDALERQIIHQMVDRRVDGIILRPTCEEFERSYFEEIWERDIPLILVDREMAKISTDFVGTDDEAGGRAAAEYLLSLGHTRLLFIGSGQLVSTSRHREDGFRRVLSETPGAFCRTINIDQDESPDKLVALLRRPDRPTAVFCYNDPVAERTIPLITAAGLNIPDDISIIGFGNEQSGDCPVSLTTFDQHPLKIGAAAAQMYLKRISGNDTGIRRELIKPDLVVRLSSCDMNRKKVRTATP